ncbi:response regulator [Candidatus Roizmanbacteria bacterium]|nr:response regulator [Candidatus Roizmanbacteria bacterium]
MTSNAKRIWLLEDDPGIIEVTKIVLHNEGYEFKAFQRSDRFYKELEKEQPDLFIIDLYILGDNGINVSKKLSGSQATSHIPIIIMSADTKNQDMVKIKSYAAYISKPFEIDAFLATISKLLS